MAFTYSYSNQKTKLPLIKLYALNQSPPLTKSQKVFDEMPERNDVSYSAMIPRLVRNELFNKAFDLFLHLKHSSLVKPNRPLLLTILIACGKIEDLEIGKNIHHQLLEESFTFHLEIDNALLDFYAKCGDIKKAEDIFIKMPYKYVATRSSMVMGLVTNG
ncbi:unnamed protein product [Lactuca saligna]|uniref:Pentatricopeptide repeat-containing protein n=1 Tax=Lactuca saligna TaxID=75948 RepID=A0AA36E7P8_LACSI|nr:unnamed protein product [Lactuca saligna]